MAPKKRLYKSNDKIISGVCAGIGEYTDIDPTVIRLLWVVLTLVTGIVGGVILYILAALVIPEKSGSSSSKKSSSSKSSSKKKKSKSSK